MNSVRLTLLLPPRPAVAGPPTRPSEGRCAAQLIRRRDGGLTFDPLDARLARAVLVGAGRRS